jgi:hypothetical protein
VPALDTCHPHIVRALNKAGWNVAPKPFVLKLSRGHTLFIDLEAAREEEVGKRTILLVEVKCFPEGSAATSELYAAIGQYLVYRDLLKQSQIDVDLYLAVPVEAYQDVFTRMALGTISENHIKMMIVDTEREVIIQWLT